MKAGRYQTWRSSAPAAASARLGTSTPPQSPVAWANFINGAGPGSHGIFDFIHRHPARAMRPVLLGRRDGPRRRFLGSGRPPAPARLLAVQPQAARDCAPAPGHAVLGLSRRGGHPSTFYDLPSNYPASPSHHGHHRCICGMGTPDMLGTYGTYQYFAEDGPAEPLDEGGGKRSRLTFEDETARARIVGPEDSLLKKPSRSRSNSSSTATAKPTRPWSRSRASNRPEGRPVEPLDEARLHSSRRPSFVPAQQASGICRFFLQEVAPIFRLYVSPINMDPAAPAQKISEPSRSSRTSPGGWARSTRRAFRKTTRPASNGDLLRRRVRPAGRHGAGRAACALRLRDQ